jgi:hypothetical protein
MTTEKLGKAPERRVRRTPVTGRNRLSVRGKDPDFVYRIVNDTEDRVQTLQEAGYVFEESNEVVLGGERVDDTSSLGRVKHVSVGGGVKAVLMKQRKDWYEEDQAAKQEYVKKTEDAMRPDPNDGGYGKVGITRR